ncbi:MFS general substrate transporter [Metschnikowia bicuspidata var. bicuspidata NRRL YB-4993]|uniref:MFS general substrate transporter n=1 Tax=Metschnikowia bicuspidata var. bicuspidata NRRL YB-4993 TaxID=869754 RepID=A0A1A0HJV6_9ASCO|nr:MFS general substrate transporter [Metschnikowia bicuspidata var. bicuspidata NRRL YB-4993]OBA24459.1 MFS general substrate transporter [Metschnikowia bicuspidata var. bicuspidata NRRL YB-4993]
MGILGTSHSEEQALRAAAPQNRNSQMASISSVDASASSAYETASENEAEDFEGNQNDQPDTTHEQVVDNDAESASTIQDVNPNEAYVAKDYPEPKVTDDAATDDNAVRLVQNDLDLMSPNMTENELNRIATTLTERSMAPSVVRSITRGEPVKLSDLEYDGPDDKANPHNWPSWKRWVATFTIANMCLCISLGSSLYVEGVPGLMVDFGMSQTLGLSGLSFYLLGLAVGPVIGAPLSEMIGRRLIYITTFPAAILFTMGVGLAQNTRSVLILRFFTGFVASPPMSIAGGSITDIWANAPEQMSTAMALFCLSPFLGPVIGPIIGGFVVENKSWRWTMWVSMMFYGVMLPFVLWVPETFKPAILKKRAKARGINLIVERPTFKQLIQIHLFRPLEMLFVEPIVGLSSIYTAFVFAVLFGFFEAFPIIFRGKYLMSTGISGLPFIAVGVGLVGAVLAYIVLDKLLYFPKNPDGTRGKRDEEGKLIWDAPESRLLIVEIGAFLLPIALFWLAWTSRRSVHWIAPTLSAVPFGFGLLWVFFGIILYYSMSFPPAYVASALAANNLLRYLVAGAFPLFTVQMYERLHVGWATSLFAFIAVAMVPIPFAFHYWGVKLRLKSKYGYVALFRKMAEQRAAAEAQAKANEPATEEDRTNTSETIENTSQDVAEKV